MVFAPPPSPAPLPPFQALAHPRAAGAVTPPTTCPATVTVPNVVTAAGYAAGVAWLAGGPWWLALLSILADELDKPLAATYGQQAALADILDFPVDAILAAMTLQKLQAPVWAYPIVTSLQVAAQYLPKPEGQALGLRHPAGRIRSGLMLAALWKERSRILGEKPPKSTTQP